MGIKIMKSLSVKKRDQIQNYSNQINKERNKEK